MNTAALHECMVMNVCVCVCVCVCVWEVATYGKRRGGMNKEVCSLVFEHLSLSFLMLWFSRLRLIVITVINTCVSEHR